MCIFIKNHNVDYSCSQLVSSVQPVNSSQQQYHRISRRVSLTALHGVEFGLYAVRFGELSGRGFLGKEAQNEPSIGGAGGGAVKFSGK